MSDTMPSMDSEYRDLARDLSNALKQVERLREALQPFAIVGLDVLENHPGWVNEEFSGNWCGYRLTYTQFAMAAVVSITDPAPGLPILDQSIHTPDVIASLQKPAMKISDADEQNVNVGPFAGEPRDDKP